MVFTVRCFKCGESAVRLVLGGRAILHARCHSCASNLLAEVFEFEQEVLREAQQRSTQQEAEQRSTKQLAALDDPPTGEFKESDLEAFEDEMAEMA